MAGLVGLLEQLALALARGAIPYMLVGGQAVLLYGQPRLTEDVDVTLGIGPSRLADLLELVAQLGWEVLVRAPKEFVAQTLVLPCRDPHSGTRIDFIFSFTPYERQAVRRARTVTLGQAQVRYAAVEDLLILKVVAGRPRDLEDVRGILAKNPGLDLGYVRRWLAEIEAASAQPLQQRLEDLLL